MTTAPSLIAPSVQAFFVEHLPQHTRLSPQTIASCRDTFRLLLHFMQHTRGIEPAALRVTDLDAPTILAFLDALEQQRGNRVRSRNIRLSALRTFFRFVALRAPDSVEIATRVLAIPRKREDKKLIGYLTREEIQALLVAPERSHWIGRRDHALLLTMYNSGARVSEMVTLTRPQVHFGATTFLQLHGKGRKERTVPLWPDTARVLKSWFQELEAFGRPMAFPNTRGNPLSRYGAKYQQHPRSSRRNPLPVKRIDGSLLMGHEHVSRALVELMQIRKTPSGANRVLHDAPEAFDRIEVMPTMGR